MADDDQRFPLSEAQRGQWLMYQKEPDSAAYHGVVTARVPSPLDVPALGRAWDTFVNRHGALRTTYAEGEEGPFQRVHAKIDSEFHDFDATTWSEDTLTNRVIEESRRPFDLRRNVSRACVFRRGADSSVLLFNYHHIAWDLESTFVLMDEIAKLYSAERDGSDAALPLPAGTYLDFVKAQSAFLKSAEAEAMGAQWQVRLTGAPILELPTDHRRPRVRRGRGALEGLVIEAPLAQALRSLGGKLNRTLFAAYVVFLFKHTGQEEFVIGLPADIRKRPELSGVMGDFINMLPMRIALNGALTFRDLTKEVNDSIEQAVKLKEYPFIKVVERLRLPFDSSRTPLVQTNFEYIPGNRDGEMAAFMFEAVKWQSRLGDLPIEAFPVPQLVGQFDLSFSVAARGERLHAEFKYNTDLFEKSTIAQMNARLLTLLEGIVANPEQPIAELPILPKAERKRILVEWNDVPKSPPGLRSVHELFEAQARKAPEKTAIVFQGERVTYRALNERANQLARRLIELGAGPEVMVAVCLNRSIELIVGLLAILKSGSAYVPIDPSYPSERRNFILGDTRAKVVLTHPSLAGELEGHGPHVVPLDPSWTEFAAEARADLGVHISGDTLAYVIYTSGSTGRPKGVLIRHAGLDNYLSWAAKAYSSNEPADSLLHSSVCFDLPVTSLWLPLVTGGAVTIVEDSEGATKLCEALVAGTTQATFVKITPAHMKLLAAQMSPAQARGASKAFVIGGEQLLTDDLVFWMTNAPETRLINEYGPTETVVGCCVYEAKKDGPGPAVPIGRPIADTQLYVLDRGLNPVPTGVAGELYIGGAGVARGYLNLPALTAEKFVPDPFGSTPGARMYKTGDLARYLADGNIEYFGRTDFQVKVRGFRIELGEIEASLSAHPAVREVLVIAREESPGIKQLVGYVVLRANAAASSAELQVFLKATLPEYMVPSAFVFVPEMPLTANGKVDRKALPDPEVSQRSRSATYVAPVEPMEKTLAEIWSKALGVVVGIDDNFFDLGGDSIRVLPILARARKLGIDVSLQRFFRNPTIRGLVASGPHVAPKEAAEIPRFGLISSADRARFDESVDDAYPVTALQGYMLACSAVDSALGMYHQVFGYRIKLPFEIEPFERALGEVVAAHAILRTSFDLTSYTAPLQIVHRQATARLTVHDLRSNDPAEQDRVIGEFIVAQRTEPYSWDAAPLFRMCIHRYSDGEFHLTIGFHHALLDGWSYSSLLTEFFQRYSALRRGEKLAVPPEPRTFRDFVALELKERSSSEAFWKERLSGAARPLLKRRSSTMSPGDPLADNAITLTTSLEVSVALRELAKRAEVPVKSVLLAAHLRVMSELTSTKDVVTGVIGNGRPERKDAERGVGLFTNAVPHRQHLPGGTWIALVRAAFDVEREWLPHRRYPSAQLPFGTRPLFETCFNYLHFHVMAALSEQELSLTAFREQQDFTLLVEFVQDASGKAPLGAHVAYNPRSLDHAQVRSICDELERTLAAIAANPNGNY